MLDHIPSRFLFLFSMLLFISDCRLIIEDSAVKKPFTSTSEQQECAVHDDEPIGEVMERICDLCHELSSHSRPNMRVECRADCFSTDTFRECLKLFTPRRHTRHLHSRY